MNNTTKKSKAIAGKPKRLKRDHSRNALTTVAGKTKLKAIMNDLMLQNRQLQKINEFLERNKRKIARKRKEEKTELEKNIEQQKETKRKLKLAIAETKRSQAKLKGRTLEVEQLNRDLTTYAYISSHDLQEPLRNLQLITSYILEKEQSNLSKEGKLFFTRLLDSAGKIQQLIRDLIEYMNINHGLYKTERVKLSTIIEDVKKMIGEELKESGAVIIYKSLCTLNIKPVQGRQLFKDLIINSIQFAKPGVAPEITIRSRLVKGIKLENLKVDMKLKYCHIKVIDNGIGFEPRFNERIFEIFEKLHDHESMGTGIGLAICRKIVENHGGIITASGVPDKGTTVDIYLPIM